MTFSKSSILALALSLTLVLSACNSQNGKSESLSVPTYTVEDTINVDDFQLEIINITPPSEDGNTLFTIKVTNMGTETKEDCLGEFPKIVTSDRAIGHPLGEIMTYDCFSLEPNQSYTYKEELPAEKSAENLELYVQRYNPTTKKVELVGYVK